MVKPTKTNRRAATLFAAVALAVCLLCSSFLTIFLSLMPSNAVEGETGTETETTTETEKKRVTMLDLMGRHPVDYVVGPIDVEDVATTLEDGKPLLDENGKKVRQADGKIDRNDMNEFGRFTYKQSNREKDVFGQDVRHTCTESCSHQVDSQGYILTNNTHGIPAEKYFDVENYIYTETDEKYTYTVLEPKEPSAGDTTEGGEPEYVEVTKNGRVLRGWKADIHGVDYSDKKKRGTIAENGEIMEGSLGETKSATGIYVQFASSTAMSGTSIKYALIVPKDISRVGTGSAAYVANGKKYYSAGESKDKYNDYITVDVETDESGNVTDKLAFTDFGSFLMSQRLGRGDDEPWFWQPRERLAGVYFPEDSMLTEIEGSDKKHADTEQNVNRTSTQDIGKSAFMGVGMSFLILPGKNDAAGTNGLQAIGAYAFYRTGIIDVNIPSSVTKWGVDKASSTSCAFASSDQLLHVDTTGLNCPSDTFSASAKLTKYADSTLYVMAGAPENGVLDTGRSGFLFAKTGNNWSAVSLAGESGEEVKKVFVFPAASDFSATSDRRSGVAYDYIGRDGIKEHNSFADFNGTYSVADNFAFNVWCRKVILPEACTSIGASAFYNSRINYLETYATSIGENAFGGNTEECDHWFYFHKAPTNVTKGAFLSSYKNTHVVFEKKSLYNGTYNNLPSGTKHWLIPVKAHVENQDEVELTLNQGDMAERFFYDSDYVKDPKIVKGVNTVTYTKRLSGYGFDYVKDATGGWAKIDQNQSNAIANPTLSNMKSTKWYGNSAYSGNSVRADTGYSTTTPPEEIHIYTKNIARPENIKNGTYNSTLMKVVKGETETREEAIVPGKFTFGDTYTYGPEGSRTQKRLYDSESDCLDYKTVLGLSDDYAVTLSRFVYPDNVTEDTAKTSSLHNAGTYAFSINLNPKWGEWSDEFIAQNSTEENNYLTASATVERMKLDFTSFDQFNFANAINDANVMHGDSTPLYRYNDGWYVAQKDYETTHESPNETKTVTNSFVYYEERKDDKTGGVDKNIKLVGEVRGESGNGGMFGEARTTYNGCGPFTNSNNYTATYNFEVKYIPGTTQSNYIFNYGDLKDTDANKGITIVEKQGFSFRLSKVWYIVIQTNMFIESGDTTNKPYAPLDGEDVTFGGEITPKLPALRYGGEAGKINFEIDYTPLNGSAVKIKERAELNTTEGATGENTLAYYINSSMPVGTYTLKLYGDAVESYTAISGTYTINVLPKEFDGATVANIHNTMRGKLDPAAAEDETEELKKYINAYPLDDNPRKLHNNISSYIASLESAISSEAANRTGTYWASEACAVYFGETVSVNYNLEGSGNTIYFNAETMLGNLNTAGKYTLYYSISALNYQTVGGADATDRQERGFRTTFYTDMKIADIYAQLTDVSNPYFQNVIYTGETVQTIVQPSQYYKYAFDDAEYINARNNASVTLTLYNLELARWNTTLPEGAQIDNYFATNSDGTVWISEDGRSIKVLFDIKPAQNAWRVTPQMPSWSFNGFNADVNFITAGLTFAGAQYRFALIPKTVADPSAVVFNTTTVKDTNGVVYFTVDASGKVTDADAVKELNAIKPDDYYLKSFVDSIKNVGTEEGFDYAENNVLGFSFVPENDGTPFTTVKVEKAVNDWSTTPNVMRWSWGSFDSARHTITAASVYPTLKPNGDNTFSYGANLPGITFYIKDADGINLTGNFHSVNDEVTVKGEKVKVSDILAGLPVGTYTLYTSIDGTDYYTEIKDSAHDFNIMKANNSWNPTPGLTGWVYGGFVDGNFRAGAPTFETDGVFVTYKLYKGNVSDVTQFPAASLTGKELVTFRLLADKVKEGETDSISDYLKKLGVRADGYTLIASYDGTGNYEPLEHRVTFSVTKPANSWATQPSLAGWTYTAFTSDLFRAGEPTRTESFESDKVTPAKVQYKVMKAGGGSFKKADGTSVTALTFTAISEVENDLKALAAGTYTFAASYVGTDNYDDLPYSAEFTVAPATNTWDTTPGLTGWVYGAFAETNFRAGVPTFGQDRTVTYKLYTGNYASITAIPSEALLVTFTSIDGKITVNGTEQNKTVVDYFKELGVSANGYSLVATLAEDPDGNYSDLSQLVTFRVSELTNTWATQPALSGWTYLAFAQSNFRAGVPARQESLEGEGDNRKPAVVHYTVTKINLAEGETFTPITFDLPVTGGTLDSTTFNALNALGAGTYSFTVSYAGTSDYGELPYSAQFTVSPVTNTWQTQPSISGWTYKAFVSDLFVAGVPTLKESVKLGEDGKPVVDGEGHTTPALVHYTITGINGTTITPIEFTLPVTGGELPDDIISKLEKLGAGNYQLDALYAGTNNYDELPRDVRFQVNKLINTWQTQPSISGWTYKAFNQNLFRAGVPTITESFVLDENDEPTTEKAVVHYTIVRADGAQFKNALGVLVDKLEFTAIGTVEADLKALAVGSYKLVATYARTNNYDELSRDVDFAVTPVNNTWTASPKLTSFPYNGFSTATNFIDGVPLYPESGKTVYYAIFTSASAVETKPANLDAFLAFSGVHFTSLTDTWKTEEDGTEKTIVDYLNQLGNATYYFAAYAPGAANYSDLFANNDFSVTGAANAWEAGHIPAISGWTYGGFTSTMFTAGSTIYGTPLYSVQKADEDGNPIEGEYAKVVVLVGGESQTIELKDLKADVFMTRLSSLGAGRYILVASVAENENKDFAAVSHTVRFNVQKAENSWQGNTPPSINGWTYGNDANSPSEKNATVDTGTIVYKYYFTKTVNGEEVADTEREVTNRSTAHAGRYAMVVTVPEGDNHLELKHTVIFEIAKANGSWQYTPELSLGWKWGEHWGDTYFENTNLFKATVDKPAGADIKYTITDKNNPTHSYEVWKADLIATLHKLPVGQYNVVVTAVAPEENKNDFIFTTCPSEITVTEAEFAVNTSPSSDGWTWGVEDEQKIFNAITVGKVLKANTEEGDALVEDDATVEYKLNTVTEWVSYDSMLEELRKQNAGDYTVEVRVTFDNYKPENRSVSVTVQKADFVWDTAPTDWVWEWSNLEDELATIDTKMTELTAHGVDKTEENKYVQAVLNYTVTTSGGGSTSYNFSDLQKFLRTHDAETFTVSVSVAEGEGYNLNNYNSIAGNTFTVTIRTAKNDWTENKPQEENLVKEYGTPLTETILQAAAKFGTVEYTDENGKALTYESDGKTITVATAQQLNAWIDSLAARTEAYTVITKVNGVENRYEGLRVTMTVLVNGKGSLWKNQNALNEKSGSATATSYTVYLTYTDALKFGADNVVIPEAQNNGNVRYILTYHDYNDENEATAERSISGIYDWLNGGVDLHAAKAGTYKIVATFVPTDPSYATLVYTVNIEVARATTAWSEELKNEYSGSFGLIEVPTPSLTENGCKADVNIVVTDSTGKEKPIPSGMTFADFVKTLDADNYVITYSVEESLNFTGLPEKTMRVFVTPVPNKWKQSEGSEYTSSDWTNGVEWRWTRGSKDPFAVEFPTATIGDVKVSFGQTTLGDLSYTDAASLNKYLNDQDLTAGTYRLRFYVEGTVNYNELASNCTLVISKKGNDWQTGKAPADFVGTGSLSDATIETLIPSANVEKADGSEIVLIRYDIKKVGGYAQGETNLDETARTRAQLIAILKQISNGTYTVTARLGGTLPSPDLAGTTFEAAWNKYDKDYEALIGTFSITLSPDGNSWTTPFEGNSWTWGTEVNKEGGTVTIARPVATFGNDTIVYTVNGKNANGVEINHTISASKFNYDEDTNKYPAEIAFDSLIEYLNQRDAGTYNVTASIAATGTYAAPTPVTVLFTVNKVQTAWTLSDIDLNRYLNQSIEWGASTNGLLPVLRIANWEEQKIVYGIDNETLVDDPDTDDKNEGTWSYALANRMFKAGNTYVFTASVAGDINHTALSFRATVTFTPISISWANESAINRVIAWTWHDKDNETPVMPTVSGWDGAVVNFKLTDNATGASYYDGSNWDDMLKELNKRDTGVYLITATVVDPDKNHTPDLSIDISVRINKVTTAWNADSTATDGAKYDWVYGKDNSGKMPVRPASDDWTGDITFTLVRGQTTLYSGKVWNNGADKKSVLEVLKEQKAGTYVITASIAGDINHTALTHTQTVVISAQNNSWATGTTGSDDKVVTVDWTFNRGTGEGKNEAIWFEPTYNKELLKITVNGASIDLSQCRTVKECMKALDDYLKTLSATSGTASYTVVASVDGNEEYAGLTRTVSLKINKAGNAWLGTDRLNIQANKQGGGSSWLWNNEQVRTDGTNLKDINFVLTLPIPQNGETAVVTVQNGGTETFTFTLHYETVNNVKSVIESDLYALYNRIINLGVVEGGYKISVTVAESTNYAQLVSDKISFTVEKTQNGWASEPAIGNWTYSQEAPAPSSAAKYGANTVVYSYAPVAENEKDATAPSGEKTWSTAVPATAGSYWLRASVAGTTEYNELVGYKKFTIEKGVNDWAISPSVVAWAWDGYDKEANLFSGSSLSGIPVVFKITLGGNALTKANFDAFDQAIAGKIANGDYDSEIASLSAGFTEVTDKLADLLNALKPATYSLDVSASGGANYTDISRSLTFTVSPARNEWIADEGSGQAVTPGVASFAYGEYADTLFTEGNVKYGKENVRYKVTGRTLDDKEVDSTAEKAGNPKDGTINPNGFTASEAKAYIALLSAGNYQLVVWVAGGTAGSATQNTRAADMSFADMSEQTYQFKIARAENAWNPAPADAVPVLYDTLQAADTLAAIKFNKPASKSNVLFTVLNSDQTSIAGMSELQYEEILAKIQSLGYGSYIIRSESKETCNYTAISKDTSLNITRHGNRFDNLPQGNTVHGSWEKDNQTSFTDFAAVTAQHGTVVYTYGGNRYLYNTAALADLTEEERKTFQTEGIYEFMRKQNAGVYDVTVSVAGTNSYEGIENTTMHVNIAAASNAWTDENGQAWAIGNSIAGKGTQWQWHESVEWVRAVPKYGTTVYFEIRRNRTDSTSLYNATIDYSTDHSSVINGINQTLSQLDVGSYYIFVSARADANGNWTELSENTYNVQINIVQADNEWTNNPALEHNSWEYQSSFTAITATAKHGTQSVAYTYYRVENGNDVKLSAMPTDAGNYKVGVYVPATTNYAGVPEVKLPFEITKKYNPSFDVNLSVSDWAWNEYDLNTNRFKGKPTTGGEVTYTILKNGVAVVQEFKLYDAAGIRHKNPDLDLYVNEGTRQELNALAKGEYTLQINVAETVNYQLFKTTVSFNVDEAVNAWTTVPQIVSWTQGATLTDENMPKAMSEYGNPTIVITSQAGGIEYYRATYNRVTGQYEGESNLQNAPVGYYDMLVTVDAVEGHYGPKLSQKIVFQVFLRGSTDWKNFWEIDPTITSWTANVGHAYGDFNAKGARGSVYFEFYKVERDEDGRLVYDENNPINAENGTLVEKGSKYFKDVYVPYEPGSYYMFARSRSLNPDGTIYEDDNLDSSVYFEILERKNSWTDTGAPKVDTRTLYLGDKDKWNEQLNVTSEASLIGSSVSYQFRDGEGKLYNEIPAKVGRYTIVATASAWASQPLVNESLTVEVVLTPNSWVEVPNIATILYRGERNNWAAPTARAQEGEVTFAFRDAQGTVSSEMPTAVGTYTLIATTTADYAEVLTGTVEFEIKLSPNRWRTLPTIATTLYRGEIENWTEATAEPEAGELTFWYQDADKKTDPTREMPTETGKYILIAVASSDDYETLREEVEFEIKLSPNKWKLLPTIATTLYLGEIENWVAATAEPEAGTVTFTYQDADKKTDPTPTIPKDPGKYILIAVVSSDYYEALREEVEFEIKYSTNRWKDAPVIKDWSAEFEGGNPFAEAEVGSAEDIVYTYARQDSPDVILTEEELRNGKPFEEGEYIMYATLTVEGYEPLTARYEFTVSSAYDRQLLMVDIILGTVACAFAVVAIVFAVRRYRENG